MSRLLAIGDIHGCYHTLVKLIELLRLQSSDRLVFLGDYIDRGKWSKEVIELVMSLDAIKLKGNHEDLLLSFLSFADVDTFLYNGGIETLKSYGCETTDPSELMQKMPVNHLLFIEGLAYYKEEPEAYFVHAGFRPPRAGVAFDVDQCSMEDMLWIRGDFLSAQSFADKPIVHGHTPTLNDNCTGSVVKRFGRTNIDTGCVFGYCLTAIDVLEGTTWSVQLDRKDIKS